MVAVLILTQSRGAYIGFLFSVLFMIVAAFPRKRRLVYVTGLVLILALAGVLVSAHWGEVQGWFSDGSSSIENSAFSEVSLKQRVVIWSNAIKGIQDFSFTGMGLNNFRKLNHLLYPNSALRPELDLAHAHNEFLQVGVELGIPGMIAFISLYIGALWMLIKTWKSTFLLKQSSELKKPEYSRKQGIGILANGPLTRSIVLGLGGGLLSHFFYGLVDAVALGAKPGFLFWVLLGLITGLFSLAYKSNFLVAQVNKLTLKDNSL
jgi:putative inorganic carbon (HCO3(-)) transporter